MCVHIVTVCEQLFLHYLTKAEGINFFIDEIESKGLIQSFLNR